MPQRTRCATSGKFSARAPIPKQELQETMELVAQGHIQPMVDRVFPFAEVEAAFEVLRQGRSLGRNVLAI